MTPGYASVNQFSGLVIQTTLGTFESAETGRILTDFSSAR